LTSHPAVSAETAAAARTVTAATEARHFFSRNQGNT
jgi:hypothetical protein